MKTAFLERIQIRYIILILITVVFITSCGGESHPCENMDYKHVCITISNRTGQLIKSVQVKHAKGTEKIDSISKGTDHSFMLESEGENTIQTTVLLPNGDTLRSRESYVEGGYKLKEIVRKTRIKTDVKSIY